MVTSMIKNILKRHFLKRLIITSLILTLTIFIIIGISFYFVSKNLEYELPNVLHIELYDQNETMYLSYVGGRKQEYVTIDEISPYLVKAFISIEDKRFYEHNGIDLRRIIGAIIKDIKKLSFAEGASTITQQYVRLLFLSSDKKITRKINEILIAANIETKYSKDQILEGYLNNIYFDHGIYGVEDASLFYFNKHSKDLTIAECATLAAIPKGPSIYSPLKNPTNSKNRKELILKEMLNDNIINQQTYVQALNEEIKLYGEYKIDDNNSAPYFQDLVLNELKNLNLPIDLNNNNLKVYTTLDLSLNNKIQSSIKKRIPNQEIETSIVAMEPYTGKVLACVGGKDYSVSTYNRAIKSLRQPASTIKPFLYLTALEEGFTTATTFKSEKTTFYYNGSSYAPQNYGNVYPDTDISMVYALATSDNIYAVKTHLFLGCEKLANTLKRFKFSSNFESIPSLALGTNEVSLFELTSAYNALASSGIYYEPYFIEYVSMNDRIIYEHKTDKTVVANEDDVYLLSEAMTSIFDNNMIYSIRPTGARIASLLSFKYSAKSGSTDTDNYMIGYNPNITLGIWSGYDDNSFITSSDEKTFAKYMWADIIEYYNHNIKKDQINYWYNKPDNIIGIELSPLTGFYGGFNDYTKTLYFKKHNIPWYIELFNRKKENNE